ncbi:MAG: hypothetical protein ACREIA_16490, partial [Opitutaceae bacterium]
AQSFVEALQEAVARCQWRVHAYVLMRNHFHLVLETPEPNLAAGMHWLMGAEATTRSLLSKLCREQIQQYSPRPH